MQTRYVDSFVGETPLVELRRMGRANNCRILLKLEGNNPGGSV
ncbi:MAG: cysteine synthase B, partial [Betaproteobacteria bacterium]|nr:cysteine synthase B [Betaproteobacteria bacterium]